MTKLGRKRLAAYDGCIACIWEVVMGISLTPETERRIEEQVRRGGFASADELVRTALDALEQEGPAIEDLDVETQAALARAEAQAARGEGRPWAEVKSELRAAFKQG